MPNMINITNCETGEEIVREMNAEELANAEKMKADAIAQAEKDAEKIEAKKALFNRLGLSDADVRLLFE